MTITDTQNNVLGNNSYNDKCNCWCNIQVTGSNVTPMEVMPPKCCKCYLGIKANKSDIEELRKEMVEIIETFRFSNNRKTESLIILKNKIINLENLFNNVAELTNLIKKLESDLKGHSSNTPKPKVKKYYTWIFKKEDGQLFLQGPQEEYTLRNYDKEVLSYTFLKRIEFELPELE